MAACIYCQHRKGKRTCPALGGHICPQCCGQHRLVEIACPANCIYLGGLSIVRDASPTSFSKDDYNTVFQRLTAFANASPDFARAALATMFERGDEIDEWEHNVSTAYLYYGFRDERGQRLVDRFLAARGRDLPPQQVAAIVALQQAWASLFEVTAVHPGKGLELRDLHSKETITVREVTASGQLKKGDALFGWIMPVDDHHELTGGACLVPRVRMQLAQSTFEAELATARAAHPKLSDRELGGVVAWAPLKALRAAYRNFKPPELRTTDGEGLLFCKAHFTVEDEHAARARLDAAPDLARDDTSYTWLARNIVLGRVELTSRELVLETMSRERHDRGKQRLEALLGPLIRHRIDSIQDPESAIREARSRPPRPQEDIPPDVQRAVVGKYLQDHYATWADVPLPALGGKTPRKAVRTKRGRAQVEALLDDIENGTITMPGGDMVDFAALRRDLGLDDSAAYDCDRAPDPAAWLAMNESERTRVIEEHHRVSPPRKHPATPNAQIHAMMHAIVENQLAADDPPSVRTTLERLTGAGLSRHEAVHAIASVVAAALFDTATEKESFDQAKLSRKLSRLRPEKWHF